MSELDIVKSLAKQALIIHTSTGNTDIFLWDRSRRLVCNVEHICRLPELAGSGLDIDHFCLITATYFSDTGLARHLQARKTTDLSVKSDVDMGDLLDLSTEIAAEKLIDVADKLKIEKINRIIVESGNHLTRTAEAMILSDARNLDDMGATGIFNEFRRLISAGKDISDIMQDWERKIDYQYWQARLRKSFRFEQVRRLAEQRLSTAERFMNQLKVETGALDLKELSIN